MVLRKLEEIGPSGGACVIQTNHDPWRAKQGGLGYLSDQKWPGWAAGDDLLMDTKERYSCAMEGIKKASPLTTKRLHPNESIVLWIY